MKKPYGETIMCCNIRKPCERFITMRDLINNPVRMHQVPFYTRSMMIMCCNIHKPRTRFITVRDLINSPIRMYQIPFHIRSMMIIDTEKKP